MKAKKKAKIKTLPICHICNEKASGETGYMLDGELYPLCAVHAVAAGDYLVTMLQDWLHNRKQVPVLVPEKNGNKL